MTYLATTQSSEFLRHEVCPSCRENGLDTDGDNLARYTDGGAHCFACKYTEKGNTTSQVISMKETKRTDFINGTYNDLPKRKLSLATCRKFNYQIGEHKGQQAHIANYYDSNYKIEAQHIRYPDKGFSWIGNPKNVLLFGQHLWRDSGKMLVVTEGEIDALSVSQYVFQNRFPVVSIPSGVNSAPKSIKHNIEWIEKFESVIFCFDNDEQGNEAALKCAALISPNKAKIAKLPLKDASEMVQAGRAKELVDAIWGAKQYRPDGIIEGKDTWDLVIADDEQASVDYPYQGLNNKLRGLRKGEIVTITAGSGTGKSQFCREVAHHIINRNQKLGYIALEESVQRSVRGLLSISLNTPLHLEEIRKEIPQDKIKSEWEKLNKNVFFYDHWGSQESGNLLNKIRYLVRGLGCNWIVLDHISIVVSGIGEGDERRIIDNTMTALRSLVEELKFGLLIVSHLKRPVNVNRGHEEGLNTSMSQLRGSAGIGQLSDIVIGCERNQQSTEHPNLMTLRVLKNRHTGETGVATHLNFNTDTFRLSEEGLDFNNEENNARRRTDF